MSKRGAEWYKREPRAFLEGVRRLTEREIAVYAVVLDLIYDGGHQTYDDPKHIASYFSDLGSAAVRKAIDSLVDAGKLIRRDGYLTNKRAENEGKTREELKKTRQKTGHLGGVSSGKSRSNSNENNTLAEAKSPYTRAKDKRREDIEDKVSSSPRDKRVAATDEIEGEFREKFWPAYPRKIDRIDALKAFRKARAAVPLDVILDALKAYAAEVQGKDAQYIRHAARWLNAGGWENYQPAEPSAPKVITEDDWLKRLTFGRNSRQWHVENWGPIPGNPECRVPAHLLQQADGQGWAEWEV